MFLIDIYGILVLIWGTIKMQGFGELSFFLNKTTTRLVGGLHARKEHA
jgi:hypothetical protein